MIQAPARAVSAAPDGSGSVPPAGRPARAAGKNTVLRQEGAAVGREHDDREPAMRLVVTTESAPGQADRGQQQQRRVDPAGHPRAQPASPARGRTRRASWAGRAPTGRATSPRKRHRGERLAAQQPRQVLDEGQYGVQRTSASDRPTMATPEADRPGRAAPVAAEQQVQDQECGELADRRVGQQEAAERRPTAIEQHHRRHRERDERELGVADLQRRDDAVGREDEAAERSAIAPAVPPMAGRRRRCRRRPRRAGRRTTASGSEGTSAPRARAFGGSTRNGGGYS